MKSRRRLIRALAVLACVAAPLLVWAVAELAGVEVLTVRGSGEAVPLEALDVITVSMVSGVLGWTTLAALERFLPRGALALWLAGAAVALGVVLVRTLLRAELSATQTTVLTIRAVVLALALVPPLAWTSVRRHEEER
ncbi:DUF6069 family protein [Amycolatopsis thailandensis]|uniref:DUF6069 family protein n=1 Tax=Amycolatopsis thailandensis TaxID=589330 RepID=UPI00365A4DFE